MEISCKQTLKFTKIQVLKGFDQYIFISLNIT